MRKILYIGIFTGLLTFGCKAKKEASNTMEEMDASRTSSLFEEMENTALSNKVLGTYSGLLPCATCTGIQVEITFKDDNSYLKKSKALGKSEKTRIEKGSFEYNEFEDQLICHKDSEITARYEVKENKLILNDSQKENDDKIAELYTLYKNNGRLTNRLWTVVQLDEEKIKDDLAWLIFRNDSMLSGSGGCNHLNGRFEIQEEKRRIKFGTIAMTKMACQHQHYDSELANALNKSKYFFINKEGQLKLVSEMKEVLAVFKGSSLK